MQAGPVVLGLETKWPLPRLVLRRHISWNKHRLKYFWIIIQDRIFAYMIVSNLLLEDSQEKVRDSYQVLS